MGIHITNDFFHFDAHGTVVGASGIQNGPDALQRHESTGEGTNFTLAEWLELRDLAGAWYECYQAGDHDSAKELRLEFHRAIQANGRTRWWLAVENLSLALSKGQETALRRYLLQFAAYAKHGSKPLPAPLVL